MKHVCLCEAAQYGTWLCVRSSTVWNVVVCPKQRGVKHGSSRLRVATRESVCYLIIVRVAPVAVLGEWARMRTHV
jgi:hypothetical protein